MKDFDYIIIGGGCAGLSLAYELEISDKLKNKSLAIIEPRDEYKRDKTWSFWKVFPHNFDDCVKKSWDNFSINISNDTKFIDCKLTPYQSIDSGKFYDKILSKLKLNENIKILDEELIKLTFVSESVNFEKKIKLIQTRQNINSYFSFFGEIIIFILISFVGGFLLNLMCYFAKFQKCVLPIRVDFSIVFCIVLRIAFRWCI